MNAASMLIFEEKVKSLLYFGEMCIHDENLFLTRIIQEAVNWTTTVENACEREKLSFDFRLQDNVSWAISEILLCSLWLILHINWASRQTLTSRCVINFLLNCKDKRKIIFTFKLLLKVTGKIESCHYIGNNIR